MNITGLVKIEVLFDTPVQEKIITSTRIIYNQLQIRKM